MGTKREEVGGENMPNKEKDCCPRSLSRSVRLEDNTNIIVIMS